MNISMKQSKLLGFVMKHVIVAAALINICLADVSHILPGYTTTTTPPPPPKPYNFQYQAGRYPGHIDRVHQEAGDGTGIIHEMFHHRDKLPRDVFGMSLERLLEICAVWNGSYSYIDPKYKVRTVEYTADKAGFHPALINFEDTLAQPVDSDAVKLAKEKHLRLYERIAEANAHNVPVNLPRDSASVANAKDRHYQLYHRIAEQHAAIAAQREVERLAYEATSVANDVDDHRSC